MTIETVKVVLKVTCIVASVVLMVKAMVKHHRGQTQEAPYDMAWAILFQV